MAIDAAAPLSAIEALSVHEGVALAPTTPVRANEGVSRLRDMLPALLCIAFLHPVGDPRVLQPPSFALTRVTPQLSRERMSALLAFTTVAEQAMAEQQIARIALSWLAEPTPCFCDGEGTDEPAALAMELFAMLRHQRFSSPRAHLWALFQGWAAWKHGAVHGTPEDTARALDEGVEAVGRAMATGAEQPPEFEWAALEAIAQWEAVSP